MKLKELKCPNCGAKLDFKHTTKENGQITCPYCQTSFVLEDEYTAGYQYTKGALKAQEEQFNALYKTITRHPVSKAAFLIPVISFGLIFIISLITIIFITHNINENQSSLPQSHIDKTVTNRVDVESFNFTFKGYNGTKTKFFIDGYLDTIVTNNKTNPNHLITVKFNDQESTDPDTIVSIKQSLLDNQNYELSMDYDTNGYFNKLTITE